jgi:proline iminopeptidase
MNSFSARRDRPLTTESSDESDRAAQPMSECSPLVVPHNPVISIQHNKDIVVHSRSIIGEPIPLQRWQLVFIVALVALLVGGYYYLSHFIWIPSLVVDYVSIEDAQEFLIPLLGDDDDDDDDGDKEIWFRTWGNQESGVPILFVHGGPGQAVADYHNGNQRFFDPKTFYVVEVDQRGTGRSQPSVRDDYRNMQLYLDISMDVIADDYEVIRDYLGIDQWIIWGGSYGSTIGINYCMRYPQSCIAMLLRGIYLNTVKELDEVYTQQAFEGYPRKSADFELLFQVAEIEAELDEEPPLDPNDARRLLEVYERMIQRGDRQGIWSWHAFEVNLMEDDPTSRLNPSRIVESMFREAQSVAFFETRLWLHETFEQPSLLLQRVDQLRGIPIWICQGKFDNVYPVQNARALVDALEDDNVHVEALFLDANHEDTDPVMAACLKNILNEFLVFHAAKQKP